MIFISRFIIFRFLTTAVALMFLYSPVAQAKEMDWGLYNELLQEYVSAGEVEGISLNQVDYSALSRDPRFGQLVEQLETFPLSDLKTDPEKLAFYINAYNILALHTVISHWPVKSIKDVGSWWQPVWKKEIATLGNRAVSLDFIEHQVIRKLGEPRIHFAIVCASLSCPDLRLEAYTAENLEQQLDAQTKDFLANKSKGLQLNEDRLLVSKIFDWFEEDFDSRNGVLAFIRGYVDLDVEKIDGFLEYHWQLNGN